MPGSTTNTNLLQAINQAIVALNELTVATENQNLIVNYEPGSIVVEFDTASIVTELANLVSKDIATDSTLSSFSAFVEAISGNVADIATDTDGLGNLLQIAGNSDHLTHLQQLPEFTTAFGVANTHFANIADRLAPDGESIQPTLLLLIDALEALTIAQNREATLQTMPTNDVTYAIPNPAKCLSAKRVVGQMVDEFYYWKQNLVLAKALVLGWVGLASLMSAGASNAVTLTLYTAVFEFIFSWGQTEVDNHYSEFLEIAEDLTCALYNSQSAQEAMDEWDAVIDGQTWTVSDSPTICKMLKSVTLINYMFTDPEKMGPANWGRVEFADWTDYGCEDCTVIDLSCLPQTGSVQYGFPDVNPFTDGVWNQPIGTWVEITSEPNSETVSKDDVRLDIDDTYEMEIEILLMTGTEPVSWFVLDCETAIAGEANIPTSTTVPYNLGVHQFRRVDIKAVNEEAGGNIIVRVRRVS